MSFDSRDTCVLTRMVDVDVVLNRWAIAIEVSRADKHRTWISKLNLAIAIMHFQYLQVYRDVAVLLCR